MVIVVPAIDSDDKTDSILVSRLPHEHSVCIDTEETDMLEPNSPKTITESSSNYIHFIQYFTIIWATMAVYFIYFFFLHVTNEQCLNLSLCN